VILTVGLTGGIASGKSAVAERFRSLGVPVIDADEVSRQVVEPGTTGLEQLVARFGETILDAKGCLDRRRMRERVFNDSTQRKDLEKILHPLIRGELARRRDATAGEYRMLMVPIMVKSGMTSLVDRVLVVDAPEKIQMQRLTARDGIDPVLAQRMLDAQETRTERLAAANDVIRNMGTLTDLHGEVDRLHQAYLALARGEVVDLPSQNLPLTGQP
jgi:dephospho-CoA kinase